MSEKTCNILSEDREERVFTGSEGCVWDGVVPNTKGDVMRSLMLACCFIKLCDGGYLVDLEEIWNVKSVTKQTVIALSDAGEGRL